MWRPALFSKLDSLGFGGKTLQIIKAMYKNDSLRFYINGTYTKQLYLTQGVKQGMIYHYYTTSYHFSIIGCNLSPLLFSLFINNLCHDLNSSGLGIDLQNVNISSLFFADDIVLISRTQEGMQTLMNITRGYFNTHRLNISVKKSKVINYNAGTDKIIFDGTGAPPLSLDQVLHFKYLGVPISCVPYQLFKNFNDQVKQRARNYLASVLSLVKSGPDRAQLAYALWTCCGLPSILYGCEVMPLTQATISEVEKCQSQVGKFILQLPRSSASVSANLDSGFKPVWAVVADRVLTYASTTMRKSPGFWPRMALTSHLTWGYDSPYTRYLL